MMDKSELLGQIKEAAAQNLISEEDLIAAFKEGAQSESDTSVKYQKNISEILSFIGGIVVVLGIAIFIGQHWSELNTATRIMATFGSGIAAYIVGVIFSRYEKLDIPSQAFFLISALTMPVGISIILDNAGWDMGSHATHSMMSGTLFAAFMASYLVLKKKIFTIFNVIFGTWLFFSFTDFFVPQGFYANSWKFTAYRVLITGFSYAMLGYYFSLNARNILAKWLYAAGILGFLTSALILGGWSPHQNVFWELLFPAVCFGVIFLSIHTKSKSFLVFGSLFLIIYFLKITAEYFARNLGWPLAVVILGFVLILTGYLGFYLNRKYLS